MFFLDQQSHDCGFFTEYFERTIRDKIVIFKHFIGTNRIIILNLKLTFTWTRRALRGAFDFFIKEKYWRPNVQRA